jgi:hypothetical protein
MIQIVCATPAHIGMASRLRAIDVIECAVAGHTPKQALRAGLKSSMVAYTAKVDGRAEAMFGVSAVSTLDGIGCPWLLLTDEGGRHGRALVALGRRYVAEMQGMFRELSNCVHVDNHTAIRWLEHLGFTIGPVSVINGHRMRPFVRVRE